MPRLLHHISARDPFRKMHPVLEPKLGRSFRQASHPESVSRSEWQFRDTVSACGPLGKFIPL